MSIVYEPAGKAKEYCDLAVNLYSGCNHGCSYCYAPQIMRISREDFKTPKPRAKAIEKLRNELMNRQGNGKHVMLSFTSDPYNRLDEDMQLTRQAIVALKQAGYKIMLLSKAGEKATRDFDLLDGQDEVGATLTFLDAGKSREWEPQAALPEERLAMLTMAKERGFKTWASLEPVVEAEETIDIIKKSHAVVDIYKVGVLNYHPAAKKNNWRHFAKTVVELFQTLGSPYYIKQDLRQYLPPLGTKNLTPPTN